MISCLIIQSGTVLANGKIMDQIFVEDMLGESITHFEKFTGRAKGTNVYSDAKVYVIDGCQVEVSYTNTNKIKSLKLLVTPNCSFIPQSLLEEGNNTPTNKLTFGDFRGDFYADCLYMCGNAVDPSIYRVETILFPRYMNTSDYEIMVSSNDADNANRWAETMMKKEGEDWAMDNKFNCNPERYSDLAGKLLKDEPIQEITIGYDLLEGLRLQTGCH